MSNIRLDIFCEILCSKCYRGLGQALFKSKKYIFNACDDCKEQIVARKLDLERGLYDDPRQSAIHIAEPDALGKF